jgi:hypothetical protein
VANTAFTPLDSFSWTVTFPAPSGNVTLQQNERRTLQPGSYSALTVPPSATLTLTAGTYYFQSVDLEPQAALALDDRTGPVHIYVANSIIYRASVSDSANRPENILIGFAGTAPVAIEAPFLGTLVAPAARVTVGSLAHRGAFFAKGLELLPGATVVTQPFSNLPTLLVEPANGSVKVGQPVYLSVQTPPPGFVAPFTYQWTATSTPPGLRYTLNRHNSAATFYGIDPGQFTTTLRISDGLGRQSTINVPIRVLALTVPATRPDVLDPSTPIVQRPCRGGDETLSQFSARCDKAMGGVTVPAFDCEDPASTEPPGQATNSSGLCDAPNVLNGKCDPGSHFRVLHRNVSNDGIYVVAHCRHKAVDGNLDHEFGDVAVIQYNANTGATCYYQAFRDHLPRNAPAPSAGDTSFWETPAGTADINCVRCHDTGPLVRSPYLAQLGQVWPFYNDLNNTKNPNRPNYPVANANYLPGTLADDLAGPWNKTMPYNFVGLNFQSWEAYSVSNGDPSCNNCHRMGISRSQGNWNEGGTTRSFAGVATAGSQAKKVAHGKYDPGVTSPIWMAPGQFTSAEGSTTSATAIHDCGESLISGTATGACDASRFARGSTCPPPPVVINGATSAGDPTSWKGSGKVPLGQPGGRPGFYYFTTIHGPFYQNSAFDPYVNAPAAVADPPWEPATGATSFRGTYLRIYSEPPGQWMLAWGLDATDIQNNTDPPPGGPGGAIEGVAFEQIDSIPNPANCGSGRFLISDATGLSPSSTATVDATAGTSAIFLAGLIGNVSRGRVISGEGTFASSYLSVEDQAGATVFNQFHDPALEVPANQWFTAESWGNACTGWQASAHYAARKNTFNDVLLIPIADVAHTICYIDGIGGDWSKWTSDGHGGSVQPYAQIYIDPTTGYHLKVSPSASTDPARVWASASCLYLKN